MLWVMSLVFCLLKMFTDSRKISVAHSISFPFWSHGKSLINWLIEFHLDTLPELRWKSEVDWHSLILAKNEGRGPTKLLYYIESLSAFQPFAESSWGGTLRCWVGDSKGFHLQPLFCLFPTRPERSSARRESHKDLLSPTLLQWSSSSTSCPSAASPRWQQLLSVKAHRTFQSMPCFLTRTPKFGFSKRGLRKRKRKKNGLEIFTKEIVSEGVSGDVGVKGETLFGLMLRINFKSFIKWNLKLLKSAAGLL